MKEIPRFSIDEMADIALLLDEENIPHEAHSINSYVTMHHSKTEYLIRVHSEWHDKALEIISSYFGIHLALESDPYTGSCPACNSEVVNKKECPECGLSLSYSPEEADLSHPFAQYLKQENKI